MNKEGKATTIFLLVLAILSLCLTAGTLMLFRQEKDKRLSLEQQLEQISAAKLQLEKQLSEAKKQSLLSEERFKEIETKNSNLTSELEVEKSFREQLATENKALQENFANESQLKENFKKKLSRAVGELKAMRQKLQGIESERLSLDQKIKSMALGSEVSLDKIVVNPTSSKDASIVVVNREHGFAIINLGEESGITVDQVLSVYRNKKYLGDIKIERVQNNLSVADFIAPLNKDKVREGDKVVLKK
jgi:hypothetical protein